MRHFRKQVAGIEFLPEETKKACESPRRRGESGRVVAAELSEAANNLLRLSAIANRNGSQEDLLLFVRLQSI